ncbi:hypothetical protein BpHYR1_041614, partial [Brachionus plicatilis]
MDNESKKPSEFMFVGEFPRECPNFKRCRGLKNKNPKYITHYCLKSCQLNPTITNDSSDDSDNEEMVTEKPQIFQESYENTDKIV